MFKSVTVIGAGLMGSGIAAHLTNAGIKVNLLDVIAEGNDNPNYIADSAVSTLTKITPNPLTLRSNINLIQTGNIQNDLHLINESEWVIEAIIEDLDIKKQLYNQIETIMREDLIVSSNTSTIPLCKLVEGRIRKFKRNFFITHFFNPPRYLKLLEIVSSEDVNPDFRNRIIDFCDANLGKSVIECKDTPGFIANRIAVFWMLNAAVEAINSNLSVEEADQIIMRIFNTPKTGVFGLIDLVGLDIVPPVLESLLNVLPKYDEYHEIQELPEIFRYMLDQKMFGRKSNGGFYKLGKVDGKNRKHSINLNSRKYSVSNKANIDTLKLYKKDINAFLDCNDRFSNYAWSVLSRTLCYVLIHAEEISEDIITIDKVMRDGFGLKQGPFEMIDTLGVEWFKKKIEASNEAIPKLLNSIGEGTFYKVENDQYKYFDFHKDSYVEVKRQEGILLLSDIKKTKKPIRQISTACLWDIGDGITIFEIRSKGNSLDLNTMEFLNKSIDLVSSSYRAMIVYNEGELFSAGANLGEALFLGNVGLEAEVSSKILRKGQHVYQKLKFANFPVVAAPANLALGGGCELILHSDHVQAHIETYMGLTEAALGICPAWGGCKEMLTRFSSDKKLPNGPMPSIIKAFETIGMAKTSTSAHEAKELGYLTVDDCITMNRDRLLYDAKVKAIELIPDYKPPKKNTYRLPGKTAFAAMKLSIDSMLSSGQISSHDQVVGEQIAVILSGGETDITQEVDEEYILKLERESIEKLYKENLTLERLEHLLETGKILRN